MQKIQIQNQHLNFNERPAHGTHIYIYHGIMVMCAWIMSLASVDLLFIYSKYPDIEVFMCFLFLSCLFFLFSFVYFLFDSTAIAGIFGLCVHCARMYVYVLVCDCVYLCESAFLCSYLWWIRRRVCFVFVFRIILF